MRPDGVVVPAPALDDGQGLLLEGLEDLPVEQFIAKPRVEAFDITILPWAPRSNVGGPCAHSHNPVADVGGLIAQLIRRR